MKCNFVCNFQDAVWMLLASSRNFNVVVVPHVLSTHWLDWVGGGSRVSCSKARELESDSRTFILPCMWFLHDGTGYTLCCLAHGELAWLFLEPDTGLDHCPRFQLSCFRARIYEGRRTQSNFSPLQLPFTIGHADMGAWEGREGGMEDQLLLDPCLQLVGKGYRERDSLIQAGFPLHC